MGLENIRLREEIDLEARAAEIRDDLIPELEDRIELAEEAEDPEKAPEQLRSTRDMLKNKANACDRVVEALNGDGVFVLQELMTSESAYLTDDISHETVDIDVDAQQVNATVKKGYRKVRTLELAIAEWPDEMETEVDRELNREVPQVGLLPDLISDYLYDLVLSLNDTGNTEGVGNLSSYGVPSADELSESSD